MSNSIVRKMDGHRRIMVPDVLCEMLEWEKNEKLELTVQDSQLVIKKQINHDGHLQRQEGGI